MKRHAGVKSLLNHHEHHMSEAAKRAVPKSERGVPGKSGTGSYPMPDAAHARAAEGLAAMHHGAGSAFAKKIKAKAKKLGY